MTPRYELIQQYIEKGLISEQVHPLDENVRIFNYTQACQFERAWDEVTMNCRGLIMDIATGEILARPFPKFFNYGEHVSYNMPIPDEEPRVYDKLDGSLGILYFLNGRPYIATRGSFTSDQAVWATEWIRMHYNDAAFVFDHSRYTMLFEIIYPENRIVVNYDFSGLVHLATIDKYTGEAYSGIHVGPPVQELHHYPFTSFEDLAQRDEPNKEGFVLFFPKANVRMKIKFPEYVRLHKLITGVSEIAIWEHLRDGKPLDDLIEKVPDEFMRWIENTSQRLIDEAGAIRRVVEANYHNLIAPLVNRDADRKTIAEVIKRTEYPGLLFARLDGKDYRPAIWRMVRPHGARAFKVDIDA